jgi:hypothetical protein
MIFYYAKRQGQCKGCTSEIQRDDFCVKQFIHFGDNGSGYLVTYHYDCFIKATLEHIRKEAIKFISSHDKNKKVGRPIIYTDGKQANRIKCLIRYYSKQESTTKVQELELSLSGLIRRE